MKKNEFNELVYSYGASGDKVTTDYNDEQKQIIALAWENSKDEIEPEESDRVINSYYKDFIDAGETLRGYGYHKSGGRPRKDTEARRQTISISGTPTEVRTIKELAQAAGVTVSRYIFDNLNK